MAVFAAVRPDRVGGGHQGPGRAELDVEDRVDGPAQVEVADRELDRIGDRPVVGQGAGHDGGAVALALGHDRHLSLRAEADLDAAGGVTQCRGEGDGSVTTVGALHEQRLRRTALAAHAAVGRGVGQVDERAGGIDAHHPPGPELDRVAGSAERPGGGGEDVRAGDRGRVRGDADGVVAVLVQRDADTEQSDQHHRGRHQGGPHREPAPGAMGAERHRVVALGVDPALPVPVGRGRRWAGNGGGGFGGEVGAHVGPEAVPVVRGPEVVEQAAELVVTVFLGHRSSSPRSSRVRMWARARVSRLDTVPAGMPSTAPASS